MQKVFRLAQLIINSNSNLSLFSLYCAKACKKLGGPISASLRPGSIASFEEMLQQWQAVDHIAVFYEKGTKFEV